MIKGIDAQIMIQKSVDYAKQVSDHVNRAEQGKDFMTQMEQAKIARDAETVNKTDEAEQGRIRREKESGSGSGGQEPEQREAREEETSADDIGNTLTEKEKMLGSEIDINI